MAEGFSLFHIRWLISRNYRAGFFRGRQEDDRTVLEMINYTAGCVTLWHSENACKISLFQIIAKQEFKRYKF